MKKVNLQLLAFQLSHLNTVEKNVLYQKKKNGEPISKLDVDYYKNIQNALTSIRNCRQIKAHIEAEKKKNQPTAPETDTKQKITTDEEE